MKYRHIVFSIDNTLISTEYAILRSFHKTVSLLTGTYMSIADMKFIFGLPRKVALEQVGIVDVEKALDCWRSYRKDYFYTESMCRGIKEVLDRLVEAGYVLGIVTSKSREEYQQDFQLFGLESYFSQIVCADDTEKHKPDKEPLDLYIANSGISKEAILFVGDSIYDMQCAQAAGVDCGLAIWGCQSPKHIRATYYFSQPYDILNLLEKIEEPYKGKEWLLWAMELQFIAQAGLTYSKDVFDRERFQRIRDIASEVMVQRTGQTAQKVEDVFCNETGFQTPKLDTRAAIFQDDKILLVQEKSGTWSLPGGWVDVNQSVAKNTVKEVKEEAGLDVVPIRVIALHDRNQHNVPVYAYGICKVFILCEIIDGYFEENIETNASEYFSLEDLPNLALEKNTPEQIQMCFNAYHNPQWMPIFD